MPAPFPRMHGITHVKGGPDPVPGLLPATGSFKERILDYPSLVGYWPMDDPSGDAHDESVYGQPLAPVGSPTYGQPGPFTDGGTSILVEGTTAPLDDVPVDDSFRGAYTSLGLVGGDMTVMFYVYPTGYPSLVGGITQYGPGSHFTQIRADGTVYWSVALTEQAMTAVALPLVAWTHVACTRDSTGLYVYFNGVLVATADSEPIASTASHVFRVGVAVGAASGSRYFHGQVAQVALFNEALSQTDISNIYGGGIDAGEGAGDVLQVGDDGVPVWAPPTVEVEHGDVELDDTPAVGDASPYAGTPTSSSGWHLEAHLDTVVLYDSNPARFLVPTRTWTRVPFDTIGIYRTWEPTVGSAFTTSKWLPDDRGLTDPAKRGLLHINSGMTFDTPLLVRAWYSIEWPVLDADELPNEAATSIDAYVRAGRIINVSDGVILRASPGSGNRRFFEWKMLFGADDFDAGETWVADYPSDNPYPIYPVWSPRPLTLPDPYPNVGDASSIWYTPRKTFSMEANLAAGDNLCLQAWQDSPWTLRFSTDTFEAGLATIPAFTHRPYLSVGFSYDPETIDHTTGKLL